MGWGSPDAKDAGRRESPPLRGLTLEPGVEGFVGTLLAWRKGEVRGQLSEEKGEKRREEGREEGEGRRWRGKEASRSWVI